MIHQHSVNESIPMEIDLPELIENGVVYENRVPPQTTTPNENNQTPKKHIPIEDDVPLQEVYALCPIT